MTVEFPTLLRQLSQPQAFPVPVPRVDVRQTHISAVFLGGDCAYKIRKPVRLPFLDFSTLERRRHDCEEEVRLNRRLAASIYLGVVPITQDARGLHFEGVGTTVEWGVKMRRLPDDATLQHHVLAGTVTREQVDRAGGTAGPVSPGGASQCADCRVWTIRGGGVEPAAESRVGAAPGGAGGL